MDIIRRLFHDRKYEFIRLRVGEVGWRFNTCNTDPRYDIGI